MENDLYDLEYFTRVEKEARRLQAEETVRLLGAMFRFIGRVLVGFAISYDRAVRYNNLTNNANWYLDQDKLREEFLKIQQG